MQDIKNTEHQYKGYRILGRQHQTSGGYVLGGRHFVEGGLTRNYWIIKDGLRHFAGCLIPKLKDAKDLIDEFLIKENEKVIEQG